DHHAALIAPHLFDRQIGRKPHAAVDLHAVVSRRERAAIAEILRHVGFDPDVLAALISCGRVIDHEAQLVQIGKGVSQHPLHGLAFREWLTERHALFGIGHAQLQTSFDHADRPRAVADTTNTEPILCVTETLALLADPILDGDAHVLERDLPGAV